MLLSLIKLYARFAIKIYCPRIVINKPELLNIDGPVLLAANHPNSFLDGMILTTLFRQPVYALARGDAFNHPLANKILRWLRQLPVYRTREGAENLSANYITFSACRKVFEKNGIVLIFSEAGCVNEWQLRPFKKRHGKARYQQLAKWYQFKSNTVALITARLKSLAKQFIFILAILFCLSKLLPSQQKQSNCCILMPY